MLSRRSRFSASIIATSLLSLGLGAGAGWPGAVPAAGAAVETHNPAAVDSDFAQLVAGIASGPVKLLGGPSPKGASFRSGCPGPPTHRHSAG